MGTTAPIRLTKPRISALILESTAIALSVVLVLWLLFWFMQRTVPPNRVEAFFVAASDLDVPFEEVPFQAADIRRFKGLPPLAEIQGARPKELVGEIRKRINHGSGPLVVYVSVPVVRSRGAELVRELINVLAQEAKGKVLLALDLAQIDSDRDLGVFGNSPYSIIEETVSKLDKQAGNLIVLTSCYQAQKSWSAEELGESVFAHYLREGLEGNAKGWDKDDPGEITVQGLHLYVRDHVQRWVWLRRESVQFPCLLPFSSAGETPPNFRLRVLRPAGSAFKSVKDSRVNPSPEETGSVADRSGTRSLPALAPQPDSIKDQSADPKPEPTKSPLDDLLTEWEQHDNLRMRKPYRHFPGAWRSYEAALLRAERSLRAATHDQVFWGTRAPDALKDATVQRGRLIRELDSQIQAERAFRFQPLTLIRRATARGNWPVPSYI